MTRSLLMAIVGALFTGRHARLRARRAAPHNRTRAVAALAFAAVALLVARPNAAADAPLPTVVGGTVQRLAIASQFVDPRPVDVWVPYGCTRERRCAVLYAQDGQMLFDPALTWNHKAWRIDRALDELVRQHRAAPAIVVAIWNDGKYRWSEYFPQKILDRLAPDDRRAFLHDMLHDRPLSDRYLRFLVDEVKPAVDRRFATLADRQHTFALGSSMGAVISVYAMNEYPQVFGGAAALSAHWAGRLEPNVAIPLATFEYLQAQLAPPQHHRLYIDHGTAGLDAWYAPYELFIDEIVRAHGYTAQNFSTRVFPGASHDEDDWGRRVAIPLEFLLGGAQVP